MSRGNLVKARKNFKTAREIKESFGDAWLAEADIMAKLDEGKAAINLLNQYLKLRPEDNRASLMISKLLKK